MASKIVIVHPEWGVYLGNAMGLGFWSLLDSAGQFAAAILAGEAEAEAHIRSWDENNTPSAYQLVPVAAGGRWASVAELRTAGLGSLLGNMEDNARRESLFRMLSDGVVPDGNDLWSERAAMFNAAILPVLSLLADRGYVTFNPLLLLDFYNLDRIENLIWFGLLERHDGTVVDLRAEAPQDFARLQLDQVSGPLKIYVEQLPGYAMAKPQGPNRIGPTSDAEIRAALGGNLESGRIMAWASRAAEVATVTHPARAKVYEQHGLITMQLARSAAELGASLA